LREERRLRVLENRVLRRIFGPKRDEVIGEWGKLHNERLMTSTPHPAVWVIKLRRMSSEEHVARIGESRGIYGGFSGDI
jgi:hypothetical protein